MGVEVELYLKVDVYLKVDRARGASGLTVREGCSVQIEYGWETGVQAGRMSETAKSCAMARSARQEKRMRMAMCAGR